MRRYRTMLLAMGSNRSGESGSPVQVLEAAYDALQSEGMRIAARSRFFRTPAFPPGSGPDFLNAALRVRTALSADEALALLHRTEAALGRTRQRRWEARTCDLDLLAAGRDVLPDAATVRRWMALEGAEQRAAAPDRLILPHPRLHDRAFVLVPLADVAENWRHPLIHRTVRQMLDALPAAALEGIEPL